MQRIVSQFELNKGVESNAEFLKKEYDEGAFGIEYESPELQKTTRLAVWYDEYGIKIAIGNTAQTEYAAETISWKQAAERIEELLSEGRYTSQLTIDDAEAYTRNALADNLCALEVIDEENKTVEKSDFFTKRTVKFIAEITHVDTPQEAMQVSVDTKGAIDFTYMANLCGLKPQQVVDVLKADNLIYRNPAVESDNPLDGWEETSEYLSGNVRLKLAAAEIYAEENPEYQRNVEALTSVLPPKLEAGDITARIGVSWVDVEDYQQFLTEYAKANFYGGSLRRTITGEYKIENKNWDTSAAATQIYGTSRMSAKTIFENLLNNRDIVVRDKKTDADGREHYELNKKETDLAQDKALKMKEAFKRWLWEKPERREKYVERYNSLFNCIVGRKFDGSHQTFPGMAPSIKLKPHQLDAVMRAKFGGNTLLAHCVGAGKSATRS